MQILLCFNIYLSSLRILTDLPATRDQRRTELERRIRQIVARGRVTHATFVQWLIVLSVDDVATQALAHLPVCFLIFKLIEQPVHGS